MAKSPDDRYANLNVLFADLERLQETHRSKAPVRIEVGKSSVMRALKLEQAKVGEMKDKLISLEESNQRLLTRQTMLIAGAAIALLWAIIMTVLMATGA